MAYVTFPCDATTTGSVWTLWTSGTASTTCYPTADCTWGAWTSGGTATFAHESAATTNAWSLWSSETNRPVVLGAPEESAEERAARTERLRVAGEERKRKEAEEARRQQESEARAEKLLKEHLSPAQRREYKADRSFTVVTESGKRYRVRHGWAGNVEEIDETGRALGRFCIHPQIGCPKPDNMLAQKLMLETNEAGFRKTANFTRLIA